MAGIAFCESPEIFKEGSFLQNIFFNADNYNQISVKLVLVIYQYSMSQINIVMVCILSLLKYKQKLSLRLITRKTCTTMRKVPDDEHSNCFGNKCSYTQRS